MGLFGKKNKEKNAPFWKRNKEKSAESPLILPDTQEDAEEIATSALEQQQAQEQDEIEQARQAAEAVIQEDTLRQEAVELARQAALEAAGHLAESAEPESEEVVEFAEEEPEEEQEAETPDREPEEETEVESIPEEETFAPEEVISETEPEELEPEEEEVEESEAEESEAEAETDAEEEKPEKKGLFAKIREGLRRTKDAMMSRMQQVLNGFTKIDDDLFEELEETLIMSDLGPETSVTICDTLRKRVKERGVTDPQEIMGMIQEILTEMLGEDQEIQYPTTPTIIMVIGVNGAGKTTTIGKLCHQLKGEGKKVLVAAADTFRAAAIDQLEVWTQRAGVDLVKHAEGSDPASVVYDAVDAAKARNCDVLICDTAGRLHNKKNLMQELAKINRILETRAEGCHREILLVLDATTGQNAVNQARLFQEVADITGIVLTKLDGTAKGGIIVSIRNELGIPVKLVGVGEKIDDLQPFCGKDFVRALFEQAEE